MDITETTINSDIFSKMANFDILGFLGDLIKFPFELFNSTGQYADLWVTVKMVLGGFAIFCLFVLAYCFIRILEIRKKEHAYVHHEIEEYAHKRAQMEKKKEGASKNTKWQFVLEHIFSENPGDWKLAIIEADSMLEELMDQLGFKGDGLGEKLKSADQEKFKSLTLAWQVHTVRNRIAHEGSAFELSRHEAKRLVAIYEDIFSQYGFI